MPVARGAAARAPSASRCEQPVPHGAAASRRGRRGRRGWRGGDRSTRRACAPSPGAVGAAARADGHATGGRAAHRATRRDRERRARPDARVAGAHGHPRHAGQRAEVARLQPSAGIAASHHASAPHQGAARSTAPGSSHCTTGRPRVRPKRRPPPSRWKRRHRVAEEPQRDAAPPEELDAEETDVIEPGNDRRVPYVEPRRDDGDQGRRRSRRGGRRRRGGRGGGGGRPPMGDQRVGEQRQPVSPRGAPMQDTAAREAAVREAFRTRTAPSYISGEPLA